MGKQISCVNEDAKILNTLLANCIQHCVNVIIHNDQLGFNLEVVQGLFHIRKSISIT